MARNKYGESAILDNANWINRPKINMLRPDIAADARKVARKALGPGETLREALGRITDGFEGLTVDRYGWLCNYGSVELRAATGRARCRCCGEKIAKGEPAVYWAHDFVGSGSNTISYVYIHAEECAPPC